MGKSQAHFRNVLGCAITARGSPTDSAMLRVDEIRVHVENGRHEADKGELP